MELFLFALLTILLLIPILFIVPLGFNLKGKLLIIVVSFGLALLGIFANNYLNYELWQTLIMLFGIALIITYFTEKKLRTMLIYSDHSVVNSKPLNFENTYLFIDEKNNNTVEKEAQSVFDSSEKVMDEENAEIDSSDKNEILEWNESELIDQEFAEGEENQTEILGKDVNFSEEVGNNVNNEQMIEALNAMNETGKVEEAIKDIERNVEVFEKNDYVEEQDVVEITDVQENQASIDEMEDSDQDKVEEELAQDDVQEETIQYAEQELTKDSIEEQFEVASEDHEQIEDAEAIQTYEENIDLEYKQEELQSSSQVEEQEDTNSFEQDEIISENQDLIEEIETIHDWVDAHNIKVEQEESESIVDEEQKEELIAEQMQEFDSVIEEENTIKGEEQEDIVLVEEQNEIEELEEELEETIHVEEFESTTVDEEHDEVNSEEQELIEELVVDQNQAEELDFVPEQEEPESISSEEQIDETIVEQLDEIELVEEQENITQDDEQKDVTQVEEQEDTDQLIEKNETDDLFELDKELESGLTDEMLELPIQSEMVSEVVGLQDEEEVQEAVVEIAEGTLDQTDENEENSLDNDIITQEGQLEQEMVEAEDLEQTVEVEEPVELEQFEEVAEVADFEKAEEVVEPVEPEEFEPFDEIVEVADYEQAGEIVELEETEQADAVIELEETEQAEEIIDAIEPVQVDDLSETDELEQIEIHAKEADLNEEVVELIPDEAVGLSEESIYEEDGQSYIVEEVAESTDLTIEQLDENQQIEQLESNEELDIKYDDNQITDEPKEEESLLDLEPVEQPQQDIGQHLEENEQEVTEHELDVQEDKGKSQRKTKIQQQMFHTMVSELHLSRTMMDPAEYEQLVKAYLHPDLPDQDYYTFAQLLIEHYIYQEKYENLTKLLTELIERFDKYPILLEEMFYLHDKYCQDIK